MGWAGGAPWNKLWMDQAPPPPSHASPFIAHPRTTQNQSVDPSDMRCQLDPKVTEATILNYRTEIGEMWGAACGRNRGVFVLDPPDGNTYGVIGTHLCVLEWVGCLLIDCRLTVRRPFRPPL